MIKFEGKKKKCIFCSNSCVYGTCGKLHSMILFNNKKKDIQCLSTLGLAVHPQTLHRKLATWESTLSENLLQIKEAWANGGETKYQLEGDNWDKNILPSYR